MATSKAAAPAAKKPNAAFMKPMKATPELAAIIGEQPLPRTEVTKRVWDYIKQNSLQDPNNKRNINPDAKLAKVFGRSESVTMFEMTKLISAHLSA